MGLQIAQLGETVALGMIAQLGVKIALNMISQLRVKVALSMISWGESYFKHVHHM